MLENIAENNGLIISLVGILFVFTGLVMIAIAISLFNRVFHRMETRAKKKEESGAQGKKIKKPKISLSTKTVPEDDLVAITIALEIYKKLHFEQHSNKVTFTRGESSSAWKSGFRYGQRL